MVFMETSDTRPRRTPRPRPHLTLAELRRLIAEDTPTRVRFDVPVDAEKLRAARTRTMLTQEEFGKVAGISRPTVAALENGVRNPSVAMWRKLCRALQCDPADLVPGPPAAPSRRRPPQAVPGVPFSAAGKS